jgi:UDP-N-acetylmuramoylalanine--D-glutamate ligase
MGLGVHGGGLGVARFLVQHGAEVTVTDLRGADQLANSVAALAGLPIRLVLGEHREEDFAQAEIVVRNPGVPHTSRFLAIARAAGAQIEMEMSLFFRLCPAPILGITGTKGKTTTTLLVAAMVQAHFPGAVAAGNLRVSALEQLPNLTPATPVILELSSFALEGLGDAQLSPGYAAITNLSADHLDRYGTMVAYAEAKRQIYAWQQPTDLLVLQGEDAGIAEFYHQAPPGRRIWSFGELPAKVRDQAVVGWQANDLIWRDPSGDRLLLSASDLRLPGQHNRINTATAAALAHAFGVPGAAIRQAVQQFGGVEHRLELVREHRGVRYINDTAATAPEAAIAALHSFDQPIVLIAGGADKNLPFERLAKAMATRAHAIILLQGSATAHIQAELTKQRHPGIVAGPYDSLEAAVAYATEIAQPGMIVLLSPGCASFGMFRNEFHRGEEFRRIVGAL